MRKFLFLSLLFFNLAAFAQVKTEMTPSGFPAVEIPKPNRPTEELTGTAKSWAYFYNKKGHDIFDVSANSLTVDAMKKSAFYFMNLGEVVTCDIKYNLKIEFLDTKCRLTFTVKEIYNHDKLTQLSVADFFSSDGKLKEDYEDVKPTLEKTANEMLLSFTNYISR